MDLINATNMQAGYTQGIKPDGRELLVVAIKGTFQIPPNGKVAKLAEQQLPMIEADAFTGEPGFSAPTHEVDYAPIKHRCDVLLNGNAYAPEGKATARAPVGLKVGALVKTFVVTGNRHWDAGIAIGPGEPEPFEMMPISYDIAFGGVDNFHQNEKKHSAYSKNPIGQGYHRQLSTSLVDGSPMPNTEEANKPISRPEASYQPMAFGPVGRGWESRVKLAGTYDQNWIDNTFPFLPADFSEAYYQAAPTDQQMPYLKGGEEVVLLNLTEQGKTAFYLPSIEVPIVFFRKKGEKEDMQAQADTLVLEPEKGLFTITWRASIPLKRNIFEITQVLAGKQSRGWWRARELGKTYYPSLKHLAEVRKAEAAEDEV